MSAANVKLLMFPDLPDDGPIITGGFPRYHIGDKVSEHFFLRQ
jgi:hypothetical protein